MADYDFRELSPDDFEHLVRDLLQKQLGVTLESFTSGRDKGIDLRYSADPSSTLIAQCKHYAGSNYSTLYSHLKLKESAKVHILKPSRYIVATSLGLTPDNKESIRSLFDPYCKSTADVLGRDDLNDLLGKYPQIEQQHFKLWLTSSTVLQKLLASSIFNQSELEVERIKRKLRLYVANVSFEEARRILEKSHYCIVAGIPGIGKTTLAEMLVVDYLSRGYEVIKIASNMSEAFEVYRRDRKQLFYYDDFLGQTSLVDKLGKNEDQSILKFIDSVHHSKESRLLLTTREYILKQAKATYEKLGASEVDSEKCVISLESYSNFQKAKILANHVYFSNLSEEHKANLLADQNYSKIINHPNYNPRIIEMMTGFASKPEHEGETYTDTFIRNLNDPSTIWNHAFKNQISEAARTLLIVLLTLPNVVHHDDLEQAFTAYYHHQAIKHNFSTKPLDFRNALLELEGNFISIEIKDSQSFITPHNSSVLDFLHGFVEANPSTVKDLCESTVFFQQGMRLWGARREQSSFSRPIHSLTKKYASFFLQSLTRTFESAECRSFASNQIFIGGEISRHPTSLENRALFVVHVAQVLRTEAAYDVVGEVVSRLISSTRKDGVDKAGFFDLIRSLVAVDFDFGVPRNRVLGAAKEFFTREMNTIKDFVLFLEFSRQFEGFASDEDKREVRLLFEKLKERHEIESPSFKFSSDVEEYSESLSLVADAFGYDVEDHLKWLEQIGNEMRVEEEEDEKQDYYADLYQEEFGYRKYSSDRSENIDSLFKSLSDLPTRS
jgi:HSP20 family molecular chaperone IbpA